MSLIRIGTNDKVEGSIISPQPQHEVIIPSERIYGRSACDWDKVKAAKWNPEYYQSKTYQPMDFELAINTTSNRLISNGIRIQHMSYALTEMDKVCYCAWQIEMPDKTSTGETDTAPIVHLKNSYNGQHSLTMILGSYTFLCFNGVMTGEYKISRKHTKNIWNDFQVALDEKIQRLPQAVQADEDRYIRYKNLHPNIDVVNSIMIQSIELGIIPGSAVKRVMDYWKQPEYAHFTRNGYSFYRLLQAYTSVMRMPAGKKRKAGQANIADASKRSPKLITIMDQAATRMEDPESSRYYTTNSPLEHSEWQFA
jgi:hypothetical protein